MTDNDKTSGEAVRGWRGGLSGVVAMTLFAFVCSGLAAWVVWRELTDRHERELASHFEVERAEVVLRIEERFRSYKALLRSGRALFGLAGEIDRAEWRDFVTTLNLVEDFPGIQGFGFTEWIEPETLPAHLARMRREGNANYRVWPEGERDGYSSIIMLEPDDWRNRRAYGYDMYSEPVRRTAMERAVRTGQAALSGRTILVQETESDVQPGVLIYSAVFDRSKPLDTLAQRREALLGWVYMPFRMSDLMRGILGRNSDGVRLRIYDEAEAPGNLLYDSHGGREPEDEPELVSVEHVSLAGREWIARLEALPGYLAPFDARQAELVSIALVGVLFVVVTFSMSLARRRARTLARTSASLRRSEARYGTLVNLAQEGIAATDAQFRLTFVNPSLIEMLGRDESVLIGRALDELWRDGEPESREHLLERLRMGRGKRYEKEIVRGDGRVITALVSDAPLTDDRGGLKGATVVISDITERKDVERRISHLATHDVLTGVPNRLLFGQLLTHAVDQARRYQHRLALLFVDLDRFKEANDEFGHHVGDLLLVEACRRMQGSVRSSDTLGRCGGDEFVVLLPEVDSRADVEIVAEKIRSEIERAFLLDGYEVRISSSIGIALYPEHADDEDGLLRRADEAMYRAKSEGRNSCRYAD
ncbi:MAG: CHASE domain-containing protein [Aromatoleum sp.]|jgi:diguanylate cyclase (GGDEF)-like protein/PAS domain S-box-containing protein|uniref:CHASE domain-containing protein n=1 Tax=Aromatoleum sp. TaxID=2307007 RepID=UPI002893E572|nr:CHASE domain-containing protein [Aromatoleum sp.]MDT3670267.1 CHASE domain-containing protein [Aromatoleum sp.]